MSADRAAAVFSRFPRFIRPSQINGENGRKRSGHLILRSRAKSPFRRKSGESGFGVSKDGTPHRVAAHPSRHSLKAPCECADSFLRVRGCVSGLAALGVPEQLEVGDQRRTEMAERLLAGIERGVL